MYNKNSYEIAKPYLKQYVDSITEKKDGRYICPLCGNDGSFSLFENDTKWKCFNTSCPSSETTAGDIFDLVAMYERLNKQETEARVYAFCGIASDTRPVPQMRVARPAKTTNEAKETQTDYSAFIKECNKHLNETTYHRGIREATLNRFYVGYCSKWRNPKAPESVPASPRLIIPTSRYSYLARDTRENLTDEEKQCGQLFRLVMDGIKNRV